MGAQRPYAWFQYLQQFGWETTIVTRHWPEEYRSKIDYSRNCGASISVESTDSGTVIRVPYRMNLRDRILVKYGFDRFVFLRKMLSLFYSIFQFVAFAFDNRSPIYFAAKDELANRKYDMILATGEPFILFRYANKLSKRSKLPWIADYRDCWSDNFEINYNGGLERILHRTYFRAIEKSLVKNALYITTAAPFFLNQLNLLFPDIKKSVVFNGYKDSLARNKTFVPNKKCTIAFAGTIYPFQPLELFLEGLKIWAATTTDIEVEVVFYGSNFISSQKDRIMNYDDTINSFLRPTDRLGQKELFESLQQADLLLLLDNKGMISGKLYEYLLMGKQILMAGRDRGSMEEILEATNTGVVCATAAEIATQLSRLYTDWQQNGYIDCQPHNIERFSRLEQTRALATILTELQHEAR